MANQWHFNKYQPNGTVNLDEHQTDLKPVNGVIGNAIDAVSSIADTVKDKPFIIDTTGNDNKMLVADRLKAIADATGIDPSIAYNATFRTSALQFKYNNDELKANAALEYANKLNIGADVIMNSNEDGFRAAATLAAQVDRGRTVQEIYDEYPEMYKIKYNSQAEGIQAIQNLQSVKATRGIFDSIQQSVWAMNDQMKLGDVGFEMAHTTDTDRIKELNDEMERLQGNLQQYRKADALNPLQSIVGDTAAQAYMMGKQGGRGAIIGGAIGAVIGGLTTDGVGIGAGAATGAKWGGGADMAYEMYKMSFGNKYLELINKRDANGNKVYSNDEAYKYAMTYAAVDTGIEMASTRFMIKGVGKVAPKAVMSKVLQGATSDTIATFNRGIGTTVAQMAKASVKAGGSELVEEGLQDINEKFQHNLYRNANDPEGVYSIGDMAVGAGGAMLQALPAVIGLGAIGGGISGIHTMKAFHEFQKLTPEEQQQAVMAEQNRNGNAIMQALKQDASSNKMAKENPELYGKIVQAQGDNVGVSTAYVNVNEMAETEQGQQAIKNMIDSGLVTQEEVSKSIEANADIPVPIGKYAQLSGGLTEETVKALEESTYFTRGGMSMKTLERAKAEVEAFNNNLVDATEKKAERVKESIIRDEFEDASDVDREVLDQVFSNPTQVKQAYNNLYKNLVQEYRENYASDFDNMDTDIKEATASGVEPQWLTDYKSNNGGKAPRTNAERRRAAFHSSVAKAQTAFADNTEALNQSNIHHSDMEHTLQQIESLERLHDKIFTLADNDIALRMQLSKSGYDVYNKVVKAIGESTDRKQRETAKANALLMAQHADVMAQYMRQMGRGGYTAMDYFRDGVRINMNAKLGEKSGYAQPLNVDVDLNHRLQVVDLTNLKTNLKTEKDIIDLFKNTPPQAVMIEDGNVIVLPPDDNDGISHVAFGTETSKINKSNKRLIIGDVSNILQHSVVIDSSKNKKLNRPTNNMSKGQKRRQRRKNGIENYHNLLAAVNINGNYYAVRLIAEEKKGKLTVNPKTVYLYDVNIQKSSTTNVKAQSGNSQAASHTSSSTAFDTISIKDILNGVKDGKGVLYVDNNGNGNYYTQTYNQSAWHGSPYDFDEFDLGSIGGGLGTQAFGWGLYFTENKNVAEKYKVERKSKNKFTLNGNDIPIEYAPVIEQIFGGINVENNKESLLNRLVLNRDAEQSNLDLVTKNLNELDGVLDFITQNSKFAINKLPTLVDNKFERMATVILNDAKTKAKSDNKRVNKEYLFDVIEELQKRYHKHYIFYNDIVLKNSYLIDNIDNFEVTSVYKPTLYNVEIPDTDTMLDYSKPINEQSEYVLNKIKQLDPTDINKTGKEFYNDLSERLGGDKNASLKLNELGIKGIKYKHGLSHNFVVFDDQAIKVIEKYNQSVNGMTEIMSDGERIISIFKTADRSTFLHEMGHVFFDDIQKLASMDNAPKQLLDDWNTLKEWSGWVDGENGDNTKAHEKFARGWESYLRSGEAPTKGLQRVFRQFSKWLTRIYRSVQRLGGEVPSDIKDIMARMIATQDDIENYAHEQALEQFENTKLYQQLSESEQARVQGYIADIKEKAKERVMRKFMKELDNRPIKEWEEVKDDVQAEIEKRLVEEYPIYKEHQRYMVFGADALKDTQYQTIEGLEKAEREEAGSTYDEAVAQEMENAKDEFVNDPNAGKSNQQIAEEMLLSNQGQMELTQEEARLIKAHTNKELAKNWELLSKLQKLDPNSENLDEELKPIEKELTKAERIKKDNARVAQELGSVSKELDTAQERIENLKAQLQERIDAVRAIRDSGFGTIPKYMERAKRELGDLTLSQASQYKKYQNQAVRDGKKADSALATGKVDEALQAKQSQMLNQARARVAFENSKAIKKLRVKLLDQLNRMTRSQNPIMIEPNMRYFYTHMAYQMGLTKYDGLQPVNGFDMMAVIKALDADADIMGDKEATVQLEPWIYEMFDATSPRTFSTLKMSELEQLEELMTGMYKSGRTQYEGSTLIDEYGNNVSFEDAVHQIIVTASETFGLDTANVFNELNNRSRADALSNTLNNFNLSLLKAETFLRRLDGGKNGPAVRYIYEPISKATQKFNEYKEIAMRRLAKDVSAVYSKKQLFDVRNDHLYNVGELRNVTKEQIIMLALNWGTEKNRQRALETIQSNEVEMERAFQEYMTDKDWEFVIRTWEHINSFYEERSKVQEELYGNPLKKEKGITFTIGGREIQGQYFPIVYNPKVSAKVSDFQTEDIAKTMIASNAIFGTGMGATKSRLDVVKGKSLMLDFDVIPNAITEAINHVTMRKAVTDVNKLVGNSRFQEYIVDKFGMETYQFLRTWVRDNWKDEASQVSTIGRLLMTLKKRTTEAVMIGRVSVALQNALNIPVAMYRIGVGNTLKAISDAGVGFYGVGTAKYNATRDFVLSQSIFMRERVQTLDKDLKQGLSIEGKGLRIGDTNVGGYKAEQLANIRDDINQMGFRLLTETDFALSIPVWKFAYDNKVLELQSVEGVTAEFVEQEAISVGDRAVRDIFGSGDTKDSAGIQRSRDAWVQLFVPFYSYANTLYNILAEGYYELKDQRNYGQFVRMLWGTIVIPALGMMAYKAMTNGDDDSPEDLVKSFIEELASQSIMGVPLVRDVANMTMRNILGERSFGKTNSVIATSIVDKLQDIYTAITSKNKDATDVGRSLSQVSNRIIGFSDTITDGLWTLSKFALTDTDAKLEDVIMSIILDKKLKDKKSKKKDKH
uniref:Crystallin beta/gamma motif-containing protein n=1 Tax=Podoviridae sp. ctiVc2 TaxID=2827745 RepID=A0A8S5SA82_9CAUD|nr:MAG TPA: crystallin beta/gamma motif-containing protein [Podoviridae sp. ctiVc2]